MAGFRSQWTCLVGLIQSPKVVKIVGCQEWQCCRVHITKEKQWPEAYNLSFAVRDGRGFVFRVWKNHGTYRSLARRLPCSISWRIRVSYCAPPRVERLREIAIWLPRYEERESCKLHFVGLKLLGIGYYKDSANSCCSFFQRSWILRYSSNDNCS
jgi:hypothetical protein